MSERPIDLISDVAMPILARSGDLVATAGAAVVIAPGLALVTQHVVNAFADHFRVPRPEGEESQLGLTLCQMVGGAVQGLWQVTRLVRSRLTDLAVVAFEPLSDGVRPDLLRRADLQLVAPRVGAEVAAFGFNTTAAQILHGSDGPRVAWDLGVAAARGKVTAVFDAGMPRVGLDWPSFRAELRLDGKPTGGPVFDLASGCLCGFVVAPDALHDALYAIALWPAMAIALTVGDGSAAPPRAMTLLDLAREKHISARGWERLIPELDPTGGVTRLTLANESQ